MTIEPLFHVYIGKAYQGPQRARTPGEACRLFGSRHKVRPILLTAQLSVSVQEAKKEKAHAL